MPTAGEARLEKTKPAGDRRAKGNLSTFRDGKRKCTGSNKENVAKQALVGKPRFSSTSGSNIPRLAKKKAEETQKVKKTGKITKGKENVDKKQKNVIQKVSSKPAPDFNKIHKKWELNLAKGKAVKKKGNTKFEPFVLGENGANQKKYAYNSEDDQEEVEEEHDKFDEEFEVDNNALQGILNNTGIKYEDFASNGRATIATIPASGTQAHRSQLAGVLKRTSIYYDGSSVAARKPISGSTSISKPGTPKSQPHASQDAPGVPSSCSKKRVAWAADIETEDDFGFKPDNSALQSILNNAGIDDREVNGKHLTRTTLATCSVRSTTPFRRMRQNDDQFTRPSPKRTSIYYTGPRHQRPRASPARNNLNSNSGLTALGGIENRSSFYHTKTQTCFNPAATVVGFQGSGRECSPVKVASGTAEKPTYTISKDNQNQTTSAVTSLQSVVQGGSAVKTLTSAQQTILKDSQLHRDSTKGETASPVFAVPHGIPSIRNKPISCTKTPQPCWSDVLSPRYRGPLSCDVLTPEESRLTTSKRYLTEPLPMYSLEDEYTPCNKKQSVSQGENFPDQRSNHNGNSTQRIRPYSSQTTVVRQATPTHSVTSKENVIRNPISTSSFGSGFVSDMQSGNSCGSVPRIEETSFHPTSVDQAQISLSTSKDVNSGQYSELCMSTPYDNATDATSLRQSHVKGSFPLSEKQNKELQALEEQVIRDLELLRVKHQEIERENFAPSSCDETHCAPLGMSTSKYSEKTPATNKTLVLENRKINFGEVDRNRVEEMENVSGEFMRRNIGFPTSRKTRIESKFNSSAPMWNSSVTTIPLTPTPIKARRDILHPVNSPAVPGVLLRCNPSPFRSVDVEKKLIPSARKFRPIQIVSPTAKNLNGFNQLTNSSLSLRIEVGNSASAFHRTGSPHPLTVEKPSGVNETQSRIRWEPEPSTNTKSQKAAADLPMFPQSFTHDALLDAEVALCFSGGRVLGRPQVYRELVNPLAKQFREGDDRHFAPITD